MVETLSLPAGSVRQKPVVFTTSLSPSINQGVQHPEEILRRERLGRFGDIEFDVALWECEEHERIMCKAGATVHRLAVDGYDYPDRVFCQDNAFIAADLNVPGRWVAFGASMGAPSRRDEVPPVLEELARFGLDIIPFPEELASEGGVIEYGDVFTPMSLGDSVVSFLGRREFDSRVPCRTNDLGASWFSQQLESLGYIVQEFEFRDTLHATSIGNAVGMTPHEEPLVLIDGSRASLSEFHRWNVKTPQLEAETLEKHAWGLNTVRLNGSIVAQAGFTPVLDILYSFGFRREQVLETPWTQLARRDGSPSCRCIVQVESI